MTDKIKEYLIKREQELNSQLLESQKRTFQLQGALMEVRQILSGFDDNNNDKNSRKGRNG